MRECIGNMWDYHDKGHWVCITTNGQVKKDGANVMGCGCALEAKNRFPAIEYSIGETLRQKGNIVIAFPDIRLFTFPVKCHYAENASLELIKESCEQLLEIIGIVEQGDGITIPEVYLPRPGCGAGRLKWELTKGRLDPLTPPQSSTA